MRSITSLICLVLAVVVVVNCAPKSFVGNKVIRLIVSDIDDLYFLSDQYENNRSLDFWLEPFSLGNVDVQMTNEVYQSFREVLDKRSIPHYVLIENVQELMDQQLQRSDDFFSQYNEYADIIAWVKTLPSAYPDLVTLVPLGNSYQGRELLAVKVTGSSTTKNRVWFDGGIHAREWISPATVIYMLNKILTSYSNDPQIKNLVDNLEIYVLPVFNVDGYAYTWSNDRLWRKTRRPNPGSSCVGTDPNRNWNFEWGKAGTSTNPCSETFCGPSPFSEIEVKTVGEFLTNTGGFTGYINFHSYSQLWMSPWGYTSALPSDYKIQNDLSGVCVRDLTAVFGTRYRYGPIATTIYPASGSSADYTYAVSKILYSVAPELRDTGTYGFLLPANQIVPSGEETFAALKVWLTACRDDAYVK
jgi:murein tripeptide amidase MpaA